MGENEYVPQPGEVTLVIYQLDLLNRTGPHEGVPVTTSPLETSTWADNRPAPWPGSDRSPQTGQRIQIGEYGPTGIAFEIEYNPYLPPTPWGERMHWRWVDPNDRVLPPCRDAFSQDTPNGPWYGRTVCPWVMKDLIEGLPRLAQDEEGRLFLHAGAANVSFVRKGTLVKPCPECPYAR
jgi:hypothetical protein